jgi:hypothetical protein
MKPFMKTLLSATAVTAIVATTPMLAQDATPTPNVAPTEDAVTPALKKPMEGTGLDTARTGQEPKFLGQQDDAQLLAMDLIGESLLNAADESLGTIADLVVAGDGTVLAAVIGVGGFLGFGEKNVAVNFEAIARTPSDDGSIRLVLDVSAEELEAAPPFITLADIRQQELLDQIANPPVEPEPVPIN